MRARHSLLSPPAFYYYAAAFLWIRQLFSGPARASERAGAKDRKRQAGALSPGVTRRACYRENVLQRATINLFSICLLHFSGGAHVHMQFGLRPVIYPLSPNHRPASTEPKLCIAQHASFLLRESISGALCKEHST